MNRSPVRPVLSLVALALLSHCGGGNGGPSASSGSSSPVSTQVSGASPLATNCGTAVPTGTSETYTSGSAVQPQLAAIPGGSLVGVWEQDRWSGLGARAILTANSADGGATWGAPIVLPFSKCGPGAGPGAQYDRTSDPWVTYAGSGVVLASALAFSANGYTAGGFASTGGLSAVLVSRSTDGGVTWSTPVQVFQDTNPGPTLFFNDRDSIAFDPFGNAYLVWDRLTNGIDSVSGSPNSMPAWIAISPDGGVTWPTTGANAPHVLYDPGVGNQAFSNQIVVLPNGRVLDFFTLVALTTSTTPTVLQVVSSGDHGATWSAPVSVANITSVGTPDPIAAGPAIRDSPFIAQIAVDPASGNLAAVWQQSFNAGTFDGVALSVSTNGGAAWSTSLRQINGVKTAAAFSPTVRYLPGGVLAVTYYDLRDYAAGSATLSTSAWLTESSDGGATWKELRLQSPFDLNKAPLTNNNRQFGISPALFLGDNQGLALVGTGALPMYAATNSAGAHAYATRAPNPLTSPSAHSYPAGP